MKTLLFVTGFVSLLAVSPLVAQNPMLPAGPVSVYQLGFKPLKQARRLFHQGTDLLKRRQFTSSMKLFQQALNIEPRYWMAEINLGYAYLELAQFQKAEQAFQESVEIDPQNPTGYINLSVVELDSSEFRDAEKAARSALRLNPESMYAKALLGFAEVGQNNWSEEAHRLLEETKESMPGAARVLNKWPLPHSNPPKLIVVNEAPPYHCR